jgi:hypothetical protein
MEQYLRDDIFIFGTGRLLAKLTGGDTASQIAKQLPHQLLEPIRIDRFPGAKYSQDC